MAQTSVEIFLTANAQKFIAGIDAAAERSKKFSDNMENLKKRTDAVARGSGIAFGALAGIIGAAIVPAKRLEDAITNALTLVDAQGAEFEAMQADMEGLAKRLARELGIAADQVATGFYQVLSSGAQAMTPQFEELTRTALKMSKVVGLEVPRAVEVLSDAVNAFGLDLTEANRVADVFFNASKLAATTVPQLSEAFIEAGAASAGAGIEIEETAAVLAGFAQKGTKASVAGTLFKIAVGRLAVAQGEARAELKRLGIEVDDGTGNMRSLIDILIELKEATKDYGTVQKQQTLNLIFGRLAAARMAGVLEGNVEQLREWRTVLKEGGGLAEGFEKIVNTLTGQLDALKTEFNLAATAIGQAFLPEVRNAITNIAGYISNITPLVDKHKDLTLAILGGGAAGAGALFAVSSLASMLIRLRIAAIAFGGPIAWVSTAIALFAGGIAALVLTGKEAPKTLEQTTSELEQLEKALADTKTEIDNAKKSTGELTSLYGGVTPKRVDDLTKKYEELEKRIASLREEKERMLEIDKASTPLEVVSALGAQITQVKKLEAELVRLQNRRDEVAARGATPFSDTDIFAANYYASAHRRAGRELSELEEKIESLKQQISSEKSVLDGLVTSTQALTITTGDAAGATNDMTDAALKAWEAAQKFNKELAERVALFNTELEARRALRDFVRGEGAPFGAGRPDTEGPQLPGAEPRADIAPVWGEIPDEYKEPVFEPLIDGAKELGEISTNVFMEMGIAFAEQFTDMERATRTFAGTFGNVFDTIYEQERNFLKAFGRAFILTFINVINTAIEAAILEVMITQVTEKAKAVIKAPLTFGASLAAIAPILAAGAAGIAALRGLSAAAAKKLGAGASFETGGVTPGGMVETHRGEIIINPRRNSFADVMNFLDKSAQMGNARMAAPVSAGAPGIAGAAAAQVLMGRQEGTISGIYDRIAAKMLERAPGAAVSNSYSNFDRRNETSTVNVFHSDYGPRMTEQDIEKSLLELGRAVRRQVAR